MTLLWRKETDHNRGLENKDSAKSLTRYQNNQRIDTAQKEDLSTREKRENLCKDTKKILTDVYRNRKKTIYSVVKIAKATEVWAGEAIDLWLLALILSVTTLSTQIIMPKINSLISIPYLTQSSLHEVAYLVKNKEWW